MTGTARHVLEIDDLSADEVHRVLALAVDPDRPPLLAGRSVGLYFEKPSLRTRHSCEVAVVQLGGHPLTFRAEEVGSADREPLADIARVLSGYHALLAGRVYDHGALEELAATSSIPVVNLLSDTGHPCQALADLLTMQQRWGDLAGRTVCWIGDYNNVARSLCLGAARTGMTLRIASPPGYGPTDGDVERLLAAGLAEAPFVTTRPAEAAQGAHAVHTDVWASMGHEAEAEARHRAFEGFTVDDGVMAAAQADAVFMHCLPAHRGEEVTASVVDGDQSVVFTQAHSRLHAFRGLLRFLLEEQS
jgi:ornithine carbamoyltransferase